MTDKPFISVVIPLYNKEKSIARTIKGILAQTYHDFEIVIIDDGSTDRSVDVVKSISDERIKLFSQPCRGRESGRDDGTSNHREAGWQQGEEGGHDRGLVCRVP